MAEVGKTRMWVAVASFGVDKVQVAAFPPNRSSGVNCSCITRSTLGSPMLIMMPAKMTTLTMMMATMMAMMTLMIPCQVPLR